MNIFLKNYLKFRVLRLIKKSIIFVSNNKNFIGQPKKYN